MKLSAVTFGTLLFCLALSVAFGKRAEHELSAFIGNDRLENGALAQQDEVKWRDMHVMKELEEAERMRELASARFLDRPALPPMDDRVRQVGNLHEELVSKATLAAKTHKVIVLALHTNEPQEEKIGTISEMHVDK